MFFRIKRWIYRKLVSRVKFKTWLELEDIRSQISDAAEQDENVADLLCSYLSTALCGGKWSNIPWEVVLYDYIFVTELHRPSRDFRIFSVDSKSKAFLVNESSWYSWASMLATNYGWNLDYIAELDIDDAISLIQEALYTEQVQKEWEWALSERAIRYDKAGKGKFEPLERPKWLLPDKKEVQKEAPKIKVKADMIPPGIVIRWEDSNVKH